MWSKLSNLFKKNSKREPTPEEIIDAAIFEMEQSIKKSKIAFDDALKSKEEMGGKLAAYQLEADELYREAMKVMKKGDEAKAKELLAKKAPLDIQIKDYQKIFSQISETVNKLEIQLNKMKVQLEETRSKKVLLAAQLSQAQSQKDISQKLSELNLSTDSFEEQIIQLQLDGSDEFDELEIFDNALQKDNDLNKLNTDIEAEEKRQKELADANLQKKISVMMGSNAEKEKKIQEEKKKEIESKKEDLMSNFFNSADEADSDKNKLVLEQFLQENAENISDMDDVKKKIEAMSQNNKKEEKTDSGEDKKKQVEEKTQNLLNNFFTSNNESDNHKNKAILEQFLHENAEDISDMSEIQKKIEQMSKEKEMNEEKDDKINDFFNNPSDDKNKTIDDFFNKKP